MLAAIVPHGGHVWFFKLSGPAEIVEKQKANFDAFMHSVKPGSGAAPRKRALPPMATNMKHAKWTAPPDWKPEPVNPGPRAAAFQIGPDDKKAELVVTHFPEGGAGDFLSNINRWRGQLGLEPVKDTSGVDLKDVAIGADGQGMVLDLNNPAASKRMLVAIGVTGGELWFYKLSGHAETVASQRAALESFLKSVQFASAEK
jgi:hypothetical protein